MPLFSSGAALAISSAGLCSWLLLAALIPQLRKRLLDQPNARSSHRQPTPRGGGVVFVLVSSVASVLASLFHFSSVAAPLPQVAVPLLALPLALVGFLDDRHNLPATAPAHNWLQLLRILASPLVFVRQGRTLALLVIAVTAVINFTNFMDGLDGLVAGCMAVAMIAAASNCGSLAHLVPGGSLAGVPALELGPAKVFMGDVGSTFLGAVFAVLVLQASTWSEALGLLLVATALADAFLCVPRRLIAGQRVFQAHRLHLFQRLHQAGWSHARVSSFYIAATAVLAIAFLWGGLPWSIILAVNELLIGVWLDQKVAIPFAVASRA